MPKGPKLRTTSFDIVRECERDMRVIVQRMPILRMTTTQVQKLLERKRSGVVINEVTLQRAIRKKKKLSDLVRRTWKVLHSRMDKEREAREQGVAEFRRREQILRLRPSRRGTNGNAANP